MSQSTGPPPAVAAPQPDVALDGIDVNAGRGAPLAARRQLIPIPSHDRSLNGCELADPDGCLGISENSSTCDVARD